MTAPGIAEAFDIVEHIGSGLISRSINLAGPRPVFSDGKKLSVAALSRTLPDRLVEQVMP